jgi:hypothetical protein
MYIRNDDRTRAEKEVENTGRGRERRLKATAATARIERMKNKPLLAKLKEQSFQIHVTEFLVLTQGEQQ